ncbi:MAG: GAF domain-containing protein [Candidatus Marinimicrobia bacterium]|nr:GAF domain-containing protein [Candidatus Neomarinimicrobiota bacterium]
MAVKEKTYSDVTRNIQALIEGETDRITVMSTIACELFQAFDQWNWVGFYRRVDERTLKVGPYQGTHGCLTIDLDRGVCGKCVREKSIQVENDVQSIPHHIACSEDTQAEIVLPVTGSNGIVQAVLDIDSLELNNFDEVDEKYLTDICSFVSQLF